MDGRKRKLERVKREIALEILGYLGDFLQNMGSNDVLVNFTTIHELWQSRNKTGSFKSCGVKMHFKKFLLTVCNLREDPSNKEICLCNEDEVREKIHEFSCAVGNDDDNNNKENENCAVSENTVESEAAETPGNAESTALGPNEGLHSSTVCRLTPQPLLENSQSMEEIDAKPQARIRFNQLITVLYDCCLKRLREIFMDIHPSWKNSMQDATNMEKGEFKYTFQEQKSMFESGDIHQWDISLTCQVLLRTKHSCSKLKTDSKYYGYKKAIKKISEIKNTCFSHAKSLEVERAEFESIRRSLKEAALSLGVTEDEFEEILKAGADLSYSKLSIDMFHEELASMNKDIDQNAQNINELDVRVKNLESLLEGVNHGSIKQREIPKEAERVDHEKWDEWLKVQDFMKKIDTDKSQYMLVVDRISSDLMRNRSVDVLGRVHWKVVFDLDPNSDIDGLLQCCSPEDNSGGMVVPVSLTCSNITTDFDEKRMQWVFANGKNEASEEETPKRTIDEWKKAFKTPIQDIVRICCENLDSRKSIFCVVLPVSPGISKGIANYIAKQIYERFSYAKYDVNFVTFEPEIDLDKIGNSTSVVSSNLALRFFFIGLNSLLGESRSKFSMPCHVKGMQIEIPVRKFQFISEYFDILYSGCENIPDELSSEEQEEFENEHLKSFLQGNPITFESLFYGHDARRSLTTEIVQYINAMPQRFKFSQIVQINHAPGTGCTTIARRVLWEVRKEFPCMIVKELFSRENTSYSDLEPYVMKLWERIVDLEKLCDLPPVVLIDGSSRIVKQVSDQLVRRIAASGKRAFILRCVDYEGNCEIDHEFFHKESIFEVKSVLEDNSQDLNEFKTKYLDYCTKFRDMKDIKDVRKDLATRTRVFHFPMAAMLKDFAKLKNIVLQSLESLQKDCPHDYEVAILVAFIQLFASSPTPASLLEKYFEKEHRTYNEISKGYSEYLLNLMVSEKARSKNKFIAHNGSHSIFPRGDNEEAACEIEESDVCIEAYSFQHYEVAKLVWDESGRPLDEATEDFVKSPLLKGYKKNKDLQRLIDDLFLYNKVYKKDPVDEDNRFALPITEHRFSLLMTSLAHCHNSQRIFEDIAKAINDITYFSHAARYFVYGKNMKPNFEKARELIRKGLEVGKDSSVKKIREVRNTEGYIRLRELRVTSGIDSIEDLRKHADEVHTLFHRAKDHPPRQFPNPLLGIVSVWLFCLERIIKLKQGNVEEALSTVFQDEFFSRAVGESFDLLHEVEVIVKNNPKLIDPDYTLQLCSDKRVDLIKIVGRSRKKKGRRHYDDIDVPALCEKIPKKYLSGASNKELLRIRALWMMEQAGSVSRVSDKRTLYKLLEELVLTYDMYEYARELLDITAILDNPPLQTDECQDIIEKWQRKVKSDAFCYLYDYALSFICVADSEISDNRARFERAKKTCFELTKWSPVRNRPYYFMAKCKESSIGKLISMQEVKERYSKAVEQDRETGKKKIGSTLKSSGGDLQRGSGYDLGSDFWEFYAAKLLHKCTGRIKLEMTHTKMGHGNPYIALEQGNLRISIPPHAMGAPYKNYRPDARVEFFICFSLIGPKAIGLHLVQSNDARGAKSGCERQQGIARK